ncbi:hypothetical protein B0J14DRAFT_661313 [Halenospora varia]|nr:hypothetical protein B0J14DRAFT_661313 [Halenospora varia]
MGSLFRFAEARQSSMDDRGPREEPWTGWRMLATDDSNKSETLFQRRSRPREEPWTKWRMCVRDDFNGSENFMQRRMRQRSEREARRIEEALSEESRLEEWDFITTQPGSARRYSILDYSCTTPSVPPGPWDGLNHSYSDPGNPFADEDLSTFDSESTVSDEDDCLLEPLSDLDVSGYIADLADARFELVDHDHLMYPFERITGSWFYSSERHCRCIGCHSYCSSRQMDHHPKLCTCSDCRPTVPENPFSDDKEIVQPHWENGSEEYFVEAFPELDVEGLLLDFADPRFEFIDHDDLRCQGDAPIIVQERFSVFQPHPRKRIATASGARITRLVRTAINTTPASGVIAGTVRSAAVSIRGVLKQSSKGWGSQIFQPKGGEDDSEALIDARRYTPRGYTPKWEIEENVKRSRSCRHICIE